MLNKYAAKELEQLAHASDDGVLKADAVVTRARDPNSALHQFFEWNAKAAQDRYHALVARQLIRAYEIYVEVKEGAKLEKVRAFVSLSPDRKSGGGYRLMTEVLNDEEKTAQMIEDALAELNAFKRKYKTLSALQPVFEAIESTERTIYRTRSGNEDVRASA